MVDQKDTEIENLEKEIAKKDQGIDDKIKKNQNQTNETLQKFSEVIKKIASRQEVLVSDSELKTNTIQSLVEDITANSDSKDLKTQQKRLKQLEKEAKGVAADQKKVIDKQIGAARNALKENSKSNSSLKKITSGVASSIENRTTGQLKSIISSVSPSSIISQNPILSSAFSSIGKLTDELRGGLEGGKNRKNALASDKAQLNNLQQAQTNNRELVDIKSTFSSLLSIQQSMVNLINDLLFEQRGGNESLDGIKKSQESNTNLRKTDTFKTEERRREEKRSLFKRDSNNNKNEKKRGLSFLSLFFKGFRTLFSGLALGGGILALLGAASGGAGKKIGSGILNFGAGFTDGLGNVVKLIVGRIIGPAQRETIRKFGRAGSFAARGAAIGAASGSLLPIPLVGTLTGGIIGSIIGGVLGFLGPQNVGRFIENKFNSFKDLIGDIISDTSNEFKLGLANVGDRLIGLKDKILDAVVNFSRSFVSTISTLFRATIAGLKAIPSNIGRDPGSAARAAFTSVTIDERSRTSSLRKSESLQLKELKGEELTPAQRAFLQRQNQEIIQISRRRAKDKFDRQRDRLSLTKNQLQSNSEERRLRLKQRETRDRIIGNKRVQQDSKESQRLQKQFDNTGVFGINRFSKSNQKISSSVRPKISGGGTNTNLQQNVERWVKRYSSEFNVPEDLIWAVMATESNGNVNAVGTSGEIGLMQLMEKTASNLGVDRYSVEDNIKGGAKLLREELGRFNNDESLALLAYNRGSPAVKRDLAAGKNPNNGYADKVISKLGRRPKIGAGGSGPGKLIRNSPDSVSGNSLLQQVQSQFSQASPGAKGVLNKLLTNKIEPIAQRLSETTNQNQEIRDNIASRNSSGGAKIINSPNNVVDNSQQSTTVTMSRFAHDDPTLLKTTFSQHPQK